MYSYYQKEVRMEKKAQAAKEFFMTYGWAILAAVIALGFLSYFGVFNKTASFTGSAVVDSPFYINLHKVSASEGINLDLKNNGGEDLVIKSITITNCGADISEKSVKKASSVAVTVTCTPALKIGDSFEGDITIIYRKADSLVDLTSTGKIVEKTI